MQIQCCEKGFAAIHFFNNKNDDYYCIFGKQSYLDSSVVMTGRV